MSPGTRPLRDPTPAGWHAFVHLAAQARHLRVTFYFRSTGCFRTAIVVWLFWWLAFGTANILGLICKEMAGYLRGFDGQAVRPGYCEGVQHPTALRVAQGETYRISLKVTGNLG